MEEAVPTKSQKATISQDILLVSATVSTLSISAISHTAVTAIIKATISQDILPVSATVSTLSISAVSYTAVTAIIMVTTVHVIIIAVNMDSFATGTMGTDTGCLGTMDMGVTPPPSLDITAIRSKKWTKTRTV